MDITLVIANLHCTGGMKPNCIMRQKTESETIFFNKISSLKSSGLVSFSQWTDFQLYSVHLYISPWLDRSGSENDV